LLETLIVLVLLGVATNLLLVVALGSSSESWEIVIAILHVLLLLEHVVEVGVGHILALRFQSEY